MMSKRVLLRSDSYAESGIAQRLRESGCIVTKIHDDRTVEDLAAAGHADAIVIDLALVAAIEFARRIARYGVPYVITNVDVEASVYRMAEASKKVQTGSARGDTLAVSLI